MHMKDYIDKLVTPLQSLLQNTNYRFNNPLGGAFLFSWLIFNWESVFYFFFSDESTAKKIEYLKGIYQTVDDANDVLITNYYSLLWFPLIASITYLFLAPVISNVSTGIWSYLNTTLESLRTKYVNNYSIMTQEHKRKMLIAIEGVKAKHKTEIRNLNDEIEGLRNIEIISKEANINDEQEIDNLTQENRSIQIGGDINSIAQDINHKSSANGDFIAGDQVAKSTRAPLFVSKEILKHISSNTGKHNTQMWLAKEFQLDFDFAYHKTEIEFIYLILIQLLSNSPYSPQSLKFASTHYPVEKVRGTLMVMERKGLVTSPEDSTYVLSHKIKEELQMIITDVGSLQLTGTAS